MSNFTPGPWYQDEYGTVKAQGETLRLEGVALVCYSSEEAKANARLISSAPELFEFAQEVRRSGDTRLASMAIAVIAKATGEHP